jgi:3-methyladenine DNA glycosylase Mpg
MALLSEGARFQIFRPLRRGRAHDLIGCRLCWRKGDQTLSRTITETEAYIGS